MNSAKNWKSIQDLKEPFNDAVNYRSKSDKQFFSKIFIKTEELKRCLLPTTYYLIGEKGSGKTAYAVYLESNQIDGNKCKITTMTETQYKRFIAMKMEGKLAYSDYANIWRSILLLLVSQAIIDKSKSIYHSFTGKFSAVEKAVSKWNKSALNPEVDSAFEVLNSEAMKALLQNSEIGEVGADTIRQTTDKGVYIKHHLLEGEGSLKEAISDLKLKNNHIIFIDGIDFRPESVPHDEYIECIKGLAEAAWQLNAEFFNSIKDSPGRIKIVLLVRPDVFNNLNLYNSNSRLQDNSVFLGWSTTQDEYKTSSLFEVAGSYFSNQQTFSVPYEEAWNNYFSSESEKVFKKLIQVTFQKPRDILTFIKIVRRNQLLNNGNAECIFSQKIINSNQVNREFSDYLLGEAKNYSSFYMPPEDFSKYIKFFQYLNGKLNFEFSVFQDAFAEFSAWANGEEITNREYLRDADALLQFFYEVNIIGYNEKAQDGEGFYHWAYRERTINNIAPKVKDSGRLMLNAGISKALDIGKETLSKPSSRAKGRRSHSKRR